MKKTRFEMILATIFFIVGTFLLIFSQRGATGAVISVVDISSMTSMFIGLLLVISALVLYADGKGLEVLTKERPKPLRKVGEIIAHTGSEKGKKILILDKDVFEGKKISELNTFLDKYDRIYTTHDVFNSLDKETQDLLLRERRCKLFNEDFMNENKPGVEKYFSNSRKVKGATEAYEYFKKDHPKRPESPEEMYSVAEKLKVVFPDILDSGSPGWNPDKARKYKALFKSNIGRKLQEFIPTDGAKEIIITAEKLAEQLEKEKKEDDSVIICSSSPAVRYGIKEMEREKPELQKHIHYIKTNA